MLNNRNKNSTLIKNEALRLGFMSCGISKAEYLEREAPRLEKWLYENKHGQMLYMENNFDKRLDPTKLVADAKSVISVLLNYFPQESQIGKTYKISKYAYGEDYHFVIKDKLNLLLNFIQEQIGQVSGRAFVDSAPILDKAWAAKAGLGWIGKNSNLLTKQVGSFYFIAELVIDLELEYDNATTDHCGNCTACIDSCPTEAIVAPYQVNGSKCISYFTIELKDNIPQEMKGKFDDWIFGCDICQDVCPWNKFSKAHSEPLFNPHADLLSMTKKDWQEITKDVFKNIFTKSAVKRTKFDGILRNINFLNNENL